MTDDKKFPFEFDKPIVQEREVDMYQMVIDKETKQPKLKVVKSKIQETVMYHNAPEQSFMCNKGSHTYVMVDTKKYIARCMKCTKSWRMNPQYHKLVDGKITHRTHGYTID